LSAATPETKAEHAVWRAAVLRQLRLATIGDPVTSGELRRCVGVAGGTAERWLSRELEKWVKAGHVICLRRGFYARGESFGELM